MDPFIIKRRSDSDLPNFQDPLNVSLVLVIKTAVLPFQISKVNNLNSIHIY